MNSEYANIEKEKTVYVKPTYAEHNYNCKPEFTTGLNNRKLTVGYTGVLTCAVKAIPRATIRWYKNKGWLKFQMIFLVNI